MRNYVPHTLYPSTSETMYHVLSKPGTPYSRIRVLCIQTQNYVLSTLEITYFYQKFDKKVELPQ